jgi:hypothetical protein
MEGLLGEIIGRLLGSRSRGRRRRYGLLFGALSVRSLALGALKGREARLEVGIVILR